MEHPVLARIQRESFTPMGWFVPSAIDGVPQDAKFVILVGNAGPAMFRRFAHERNPATSLMDEWTRVTLDRLASELAAKVVYPFDKPALPFLTWARRAGAGHVSPLGLNIHPVYGLWHAYRAALLFPMAFDLPRPPETPNPCDSCAAKPCLSACPVSAFDGSSYDVQACATRVMSEAGADCMTGGCKARLSCPVGKSYEYSPQQKQFHMKAFVQARLKD